MLEDACIALDVLLAAHSSDGAGGGSNFSLLSSLLQQRSLLQAELHSQQSYADLMNEMATYTTLTVGEGALLEELQKEAAAAHKQAEDTVRYYQECF